MSDELPLRQKLNAETARLPWSALLRFFARGEVISVAAEIDLLDVAVAMAEDDAERVAAWMRAELVMPVSDTAAQRWQAADAQVWTVVVRPWVLVQERG